MLVPFGMVNTWTCCQAVGVAMPVVVDCNSVTVCGVTTASCQRRVEIERERAYIRSAAISSDMLSAFVPNVRALSAMNVPDSSAMMATTTIISINVKPRCARRFMSRGSPSGSWCRRCS